MCGGKNSPNAVLPPDDYDLVARVQYGEQMTEVVYGETFSAEEAFVDLTTSLLAVTLPSETVVPGDSGQVIVWLANTGNVLRGETARETMLNPRARFSCKTVTFMVAVLSSILVL